MNGKKTILVRRSDVEELLGQFNEHAHSSWSNWLSTKIQELPTLTVRGELHLQGRETGSIADADSGTAMKDAMTKTLYSIARSLDQLTNNLQRELRSESQKQTNADWIRNMTDEELATVLADSWPCSFNYNGEPCNVHDGNCRACCLQFLKEKRGTTGNKVNPNAEV